MLAPQGFLNHAMSAEVTLIKVLSFNEILNDGFLISSAGVFRDKTRVLEHGEEVKVRA